MPSLSFTKKKPQKKYINTLIILLKEWETSDLFLFFCTFYTCFAAFNPVNINNSKNHLHVLIYKDIENRENAIFQAQKRFLSKLFKSS